MPNYSYLGYHNYNVAVNLWNTTTLRAEPKFTYTFENFFHPYVGEVIATVNQQPLSAIFEPATHAKLDSGDPASATDFFNQQYRPAATKFVSVRHFRKSIDLRATGSYANYNWELFFHIPVSIAVHLMKTQRFAEAQRWFHYVFDPTSNDRTVDAPLRFWKFAAFRQPKPPRGIRELLTLLSTPTGKLTAEEQELRTDILAGYRGALTKPFQPHVVARTRPIAYQYFVVMKYLDNLIAWGDQLFQQDTVESINEATQRYVLAVNILGPRPQNVPPRGTVKPKTFAQLMEAGLDPMGNAMVELEAQLPFNLSGAPAGADLSGATPLLGIGRTLYFCIPRNEKLLGYWDTVADRLFKIRHCMNIAGVVRPLALFDPPIDPGMLVKAAAAGIYIGSIVNGLNQPAGPVRSLTMIQKALELCSEVRGLGGALLSALEKGDAEQLALIRQRHDIQIQQMMKDVRFLQWKAAQEATQSLLTSRGTALQRLSYYQRLLGLPADPNAPASVGLDRRELTEENFDEQYAALVGQYDRTLASQPFPRLALAGGASPAQGAGLTGAGRSYLNANEFQELNVLLPLARDTRMAASIADTLASVLLFLPEININLQYWGLGASPGVFGGSKVGGAAKIAAEILRTISAVAQDQAGMASRSAGHERRADDWIFQYNLAAREVMQIGRQILSALIAEQIAYHEYSNVEQQIANAREVDDLLHSKFTNRDLYLWMQGETSRLYYEYYRLAFDTARKAERTMKQELMRPELEEQTFVKFNYWDGGRKGLLAGEALHLDVKRMELAYHEHNKRELELTRHISLRQLDPLALLTLRATSSCQVTIPEWLYDRDCPGHYMRRIKSVALSLPSVTGPYTSVHCTLTLLRSSVRKSSQPKDNEYVRQEGDDRFIDYQGSVQSIVTSGANQDSGMFETNLRDDRFLPFEGAGAESTWKLDLPQKYRAFDYMTISDVVFHVRYTARQGVEPSRVEKALSDIFADASKPNLLLLFSLRHDFAMQWSTFIGGDGDLEITLSKDHFPYLAQGRNLLVTSVDLYAVNDTSMERRSLDSNALPDLSSGSAKLTIPADSNVLRREVSVPVLLLIGYTI